MKLYAALASALFTASLSSIAVAGPVVDAAERAEDFLDDGEYLQALEALEDAVETVWEESPLLFRNVTIVESSSGHGIYEERDTTFQADDTMRVYVEPVGYGYGQAGDLRTIELTTDVAIQNETGQVLVEVEDAFAVEVETAVPKRELSMTLSFGVPYLRPGEYVSVFTVTDENSDKSGTFEVPFTVAAPVSTEAETNDAPAAASAGSDGAEEPSQTLRESRSGAAGSGITAGNGTVEPEANEPADAPKKNAEPEGSAQ